MLTMTLEPDKEEPDERGSAMAIDDGTAKLIVASYRNIHNLKLLLNQLPYFQSEKLFAGALALTKIMDRAIEDIPLQDVLLSIHSGIALSRHLIETNTAIQPTNIAIAQKLQVILEGFQHLHSRISPTAP